MPASRNPIGITKLQVQGLSTLKGLSFSSSTSDGHAPKTQNFMARRLHDGTKLDTIQLRIFWFYDIALHFEEPSEDGINCPVINITTPTSSSDAKLPVMVYIYGSSFLFGGANKGVFDSVYLTTFSAERGPSVVTFNFDYHVGLGGLLAPDAIKQDLECDGHEDDGFGLLDQQVARHWVNLYIVSFDGDPDNVTYHGESKGGISVLHQIVARNPALFHRAIAMSGHLNPISIWSLEQHEKHSRAVLRYLCIDASSPSIFYWHRDVPESDTAAATIPIEGNFNAPGHPCDDGVFLMMNTSPNRIPFPPAWLKRNMIEDTADEATIFTHNLRKETYGSIQTDITAFLGKEVTDALPALYCVTPDLSK
ncbi:lipase 3 [Fusarium beomiforme]|uniref:Lipase 3 n=1 Tax=Fusarium beomiforme TaxID=44412 RepID=A0A9P5AI47_9HYPO|nr:lipase 3 [Fusarium beomiforme]